MKIISIKSYLISRLQNFIFSVLNNWQKRQTKDIGYQISLRSLDSTVNYVLKNMKNIESVNTKWDLHIKALKSIRIDNGAFLEFGVYKGETINFIANNVNNTIYGFDSFEGLPEYWRDGFPQGSFSINKLPKVYNNVVLVKGWFDETIPKFLVEHSFEAISYLHIDCDLYSSTKTIFKLLESKIVSGTIIVFDEYFNFPGWENDEYFAFQEFISETNLKYEYITYNKLSEQVAVRII
jgi:hypothetical protein